MARNKINRDLPKFNDMMLPTLKALIELGGSGTINEISNKVYDIFTVSKEIMQILHRKVNTITEVEYPLAWSLTYLKKAGLIAN